jgi:hypothetical protein
MDKKEAVLFVFIGMIIVVIGIVKSTYSYYDPSMHFIVGGCMVVFNSAYALFVEFNDE